MIKNVFKKSLIIVLIFLVISASITPFVGSTKIVNGKIKTDSPKPAGTYRSIGGPFNMTFYGETTLSILDLSPVFTPLMFAITLDTSNNPTAHFWARNHLGEVIDHNFTGNCRVWALLIFQSDTNMIEGTNPHGGYYSCTWALLVMANG